MSFTWYLHLHSVHQSRVKRTKEMIAANPCSYDVKLQWNQITPNEIRTNLKANFLFGTSRVRYSSEISWQVTRTGQKIGLITASKRTWQGAHYFLHSNYLIFVQVISVA